MGLSSRIFLSLHRLGLFPRYLSTGNCCLSSKQVELTSVRYPEVAKYKGKFTKLTQDDIQHFRSILEPSRVLTEDIEGYNTDWLRTVRGQSDCVLKPKTTQEVSGIISHCYNRGIAVCPQAGNTGLVGGSVPILDEVILSTELMNKIEAVDENSGIVTMQCGVVLEQLDNYLSNYGLMAPLDLGAKGSCQIGGNVSTNAGGLRLIRYGSLHANVLGLEAVLAQEGGPVLDCLKVALKKDNTGYDLKHLFIGAEGTLGVVTKLALYCPPRSNSVKLAFLQVGNFDQVLSVYRKARQNLGEIMSSCEFIDSASMKCVTENLNLTSPLEVSQTAFYVLIETSGSNSDHDEEKLNGFLEGCMESGIIETGILATEPSKMANLWSIRERIAEALLKDGYCYKYDISLPLNVFYDSVLVLRERLGSQALRCVGYGHLGDGNMHLNITTKEYDSKVMKTIEPFIFEWTCQQKGSISAEHGIGFKKKDYIHFSKPAKAVEMMKQLKNVFDPKGILNPYKVLPEKIQ